MGSFARVSTVIRAQSTAVQERIRRAVADATEPYATPHGLDIPVAFRLAVGRRAEQPAKS